MRRNINEFTPQVLFALILLSITCVTIFMAVKMPVLRAQIRSLPDLKERVAAENETLKTIAQLMGGAVILLGIYFTSKTISISHEGQVTDRFSKAIDHFGDEKLSVRLGGIYALSRIAADSYRDAGTIVEIFSSFLREATTGSGPGVVSLVSRPPADVSAIMSILGSAEWAKGKSINLFGCRFVGLMIKDLNLESAILNSSSFLGCDLQGARFDGSQMMGADFTGSYLRGCSFVRCDATVCNFGDSHLRAAIFRSAKIFGANFASASLIDADFRGATGAVLDQFFKAITDESTILPTFEGLS